MKNFIAFIFVCATFYSRSQSVCAGSSFTLQAGNPQNYSNPSYSLNPGGFGSPNGIFVVSPNVTTTYTLYTYQPQSPFSSTAVVQVTVNPQPLTNPQVIQPSCTSSVGGFNLGLTFNPSNVTPGYTVMWAPLPNGVLNQTQTAVSTGVQAGPYAATITAVGGCSTVANFTLNPAPEPADFVLLPGGTTQTITCDQQTLTVSASESSYSYTWSSANSNPITTSTVNLTNLNLGTWTVSGKNPVSGCIKTFTFNVIQNVLTPQSTVTPMSQNITCALSSITTVSVYATPTVNVMHYIYSPQGGTFSANSHTAIYFPGGTGNYTHCVINLENGCTTCKVFTITSSQGFPTFSLTSAENFTLGCNSRSVANISIDNGNTSNPQGGPVSYTLLAPTYTGSLPPTGTLSSVSLYSVNVPGNYTVVVRDNTTGCETRIPVSIIQNTFTPQITAVVPLSVLDCNTPSTILKGTSDTKNVAYQWSFQGSPGVSPGSTIAVNTDPSAPTKTVINSYTLTITDNSSSCRSTTVIPMLQNLFLPKVAFAIGTKSLTCSTPTAVLTNISTTGILPGTFFVNQPVIAFLWKGPTPQVPQQLSTTYVAGVYGTYTLTGKDLNNGCMATATGSIDDLRDYPIINNPKGPPQASLDCGINPSTLLSVSITPESMLKDVTYFWTPPPGQNLSNQTTPTILVDKIGIFSVTVTNIKNNCVSSATVSVIPGTLTAEFEADKKSGVAPLTVKFFNNSVSSKSKDNINSYWSFGNGKVAVTSETKAATPVSTVALGGFTYAAGMPATENPSTTYIFPGTYSVSLFVVKGECIDTMVQFIKVELPSKLEIPNVFTPNDDKVNDEFFVTGTNLSTISMTIYDRWGKLVFEVTSGSGNIIWDGKTGFGTDAAEGTYYYVVTATGKEGTDYKTNGTVQLIR